MPILQMGKLRPRGEKSLAQGHKSGNWLSWDLKAGLPSS